MVRIRVRNFGPIKDNNEWIEIGKVTLLIGSQGAGKSSIAKLMSTFLWMEKSLNRGDHSMKYFERKSRFKNQFLTYHRIENYLKDNTEIEYEGDSYSFHYKDKNLQVTQRRNADSLPQIMYVPAERNFLTYIESFKELKVVSAALREFRDEYKNAQKTIKGTFKLPVAGAVLEYDRQNDILHLKGDDYKLRISETASGYQSLVPLYLVSWNLAQSIKNNSELMMTEEERERFRKMIQDIVNNKNFTEQQQRDAISSLSGKFTKNAFVNIVEEPEQNLFPKSQWEMLLALSAINNMCGGNRLVMTTHSPYVISYLTLMVKAHSLLDNVKRKELDEQLNNVVPVDAVVDGAGLFVYELDEAEGTYNLLEGYKGMPSDDNYLNNSLADGNEMFAKLLELEASCR